MSKNIVVIGGGIMGLASSYYLQNEDHQVTVIDQSNMDAGASYVNAGYFRQVILYHFQLQVLCEKELSGCLINLAHYILSHD